MLWSYDTMRNIADITIHPVRIKNCITGLQERSTKNGKIIKWMNPRGNGTTESNAEMLLPLLAMPMRNLFSTSSAGIFLFPVWSTVCFTAGIQESFSGCGWKLSTQLSYFCVYPYSPERVLDLFRK